MRKTLYLFISVLAATVQLGIAQPLANFRVNHADEVKIKEPRFTENKGQWNENILFKLELSNAHLYLEQNRFTWVFYDPEFLEMIHLHKKNEWNIINNAFAYYVNFLNANSDIKVFGNKSNSDYSNYFIGKDSTHWVSHVNSFSEVHYKNLYPGIDMRVYGKNNLLKYDFTVAEGVSVSQINMQYEGAEKVFIENDKLKIINSFNTVTEQKPVAWQLIGNEKKIIPCSFELKQNTVSFAFPEGYDTNYELVIDPQIEFSTYSGSTADNWGYSATYNTAGNFYAAGIAFAPGYPITSGTYQVNFGGGTGAYPTDIALTKFSSDGSSLVYSTYIGSSGTEMPFSMVVNENDELFIYGATGSSDFPITSGAYDQSFNGGAFTLVQNVLEFTNGSDIYISKISSNGAALLASTYIGGTGNDGLNNVSPLNYNYADYARGEIFIDNSGNVIVGSCTSSSNFPITSGSQQQTYGGNQDGCLFRLNSTLSNLQWSTYHGGTSGDAIYSVKTNSTGTVFVCGGTASSDFSTTSGVLNQAFLGGITDGFVSAFNPANATMISSSFIGTDLYDQAYFIEIDGDDDTYLYGQTLGSYPVTNGVYSNAGSKQFIHKINNTLSSTYFSTVFGDGGSLINISPTAFLVDVCEKIYAAGWGGVVNSSFALGANLGSTIGMPVSNDGYQLTTDGSDFYFMVLEPDAVALLYGTFLGADGLGEHVDGGTSRFDKNGIIYQAVCAGCGGSDMFPTTPGVWSNTNNSTNCNLGATKFFFPYTTNQITIDTTNFPLIVSSSSSGNQWYQNNAIIPGAINQSYTVQTPLNDTTCFSVVVPDSDGCPVWSNPVCFNPPPSGMSSLYISNLFIFPNPANTEIIVNGYNPAYLKLYNTLGQAVAEATKTNKLWLGNLSHGLYLLQIFDEKGWLIKTEKVVKQ